MPSATPTRYLNQANRPRSRYMLYNCVPAVSRRNLNSNVYGMWYVVCGVWCVLRPFFFIGREQSRETRTLWTDSDTRLLQYAGSMLKDAAAQVDGAPAPQTRHIKTHKHPASCRSGVSRSGTKWPGRRPKTLSLHTLPKRSLPIRTSGLSCLLSM